MDSGQIDGGLFGSGMGKLMGLVVVLPVLVGELKLGTAFGYKQQFSVKINRMGDLASEG